MNLVLKCFFALSLLPSIIAFSFASEIQISVPFYSENLKIQYDPQLIISGPNSLKEKEIVNYYQVLEDAPYESLLNSLKKNKYQLGLNDWLCYELIKETVQLIYTRKAKRQKTLTIWFLLSKMNYDTRLAFLNNEAFIYVRTEDNIYETPLIEDSGTKFVGLTEMQQQRTRRNKAVYLLNFLAAPNGNPFTFSLRQLPQLKEQIEGKTFKFTWAGQTFEMLIKMDKTLVDIMKKYPIIDETGYLKTPFSSQLKGSLLPSLKKILEGKNTIESLEILSTFTRSAFKYREDEDYFGRSKPMIRDEVFFYPYSDCEDRSAVFYGLVEELLDLPMIVIAFPDHLTVAVALEEPIGPAISYKGKKFYICDPTGPFNSSKIGDIPRGYEQQSFEILLDNL